MPDTIEVAPSISLRLPGRVLGRWWLVLQCIITPFFIVQGLAFFRIVSLSSDVRGTILYVVMFVISIGWITVWLAVLWLVVILVLGEDHVDVRDGVLKSSRRYRQLGTPVRRIDLTSAAGLKVSRRDPRWGRPHVVVSGDRVNDIRIGHGMGPAEIDRVVVELGAVVAAYAPERDPGYRMVL